MPRTDPTEGRPATRDLQVRVKVETLDLRGGAPWLHFVAELYERQGSKWSRLTCRTGDCSVDEAVAGDFYTKVLAELTYQLARDGREPAP